MTPRRATAGGLFVLGLAVGLPALAAPAAPAENAVLVARVDGTIGPVTPEYLGDGIDRAERSGHAAFVVELDTPGGLDTSMRAIVRRFLASEVPVVVYVSPSGARAASAGAIITLAAEVAAMAPGTAIGAATPVSLEGGDLDQKIVNDAAAYAESLAALHERNADLAVAMVRQGRSLPAAVALGQNVVDVVAPTLGDLLERIDRERVRLGGEGREVELQTAGAEIERHEMGLLRRVQTLLADPNLAYIFLSIGALALLYELASPGIGAGGIVGVVFLLLGFFAVSVLPVNVVGLLFLAFAIALFVAELFAPGVGIAAAGGTLSLVLSGVFLFRDVPGVAVSLTVLVPVTLVVGAGVILAGRLAWRARVQPPQAALAFAQHDVVVRRVEGERAQALFEGAWWTLRSPGHRLRVGDTVRVVARDGLDLVVEPKEGTS